MAKPAFIYAFDNLGPYRFVELCAELLGARYKGFILGGVGADGGIDGEIDNVLGEWNPEATDDLSNQIIESGQKVIFQFKHKVTARIGQSNARSQLLNLYKSVNGEVTKDLIIKGKPDIYVLITNIEINAQFRNSFQEVCRSSNPDISYYKVIGLDELENWITQATNLRHLYFPTIFDLPRYNLKLVISEGFYYPEGRSFQVENAVELLTVIIYNIGIASSYIDAIQFRLIDNGQEKIIQKLGWENMILEKINPKKGVPLEAGRNATYYFRKEELKEAFKDMFLSEIIVMDEIQNRYSISVTDAIRQKIFGTQ